MSTALSVSHVNGSLTFEKTIEQTGAVPLAPNTIQWNLTKSLGTGQIRSLNRGLVISRFFFIYFTITGTKNTVCYIEVFC